jgi:integrase
MQLWKHANGRWYILHGSRLKQRTSTGASDRKEAEIFLVQFAVDHAKDSGDFEAGKSVLANVIADSKIAKNTREFAGALLAQLIAYQATGSGSANPNIREILEAYRDEHGPTVRSPAAIKTAVDGLVPLLGDFRPEHLTPLVVRDQYVLRRMKKPGKGYRPPLTAEKSADGTILKEIGVLRAALQWAAMHKRINRTDIPKIPNPVPTPAPRDRWLTREEADSLYAACLEPHMKLFVILALMTVPRMAALLEAKLDQVDWNLRRLDFGQGHGNKHRPVVPLNDEAYTALVTSRELSCSGYIIEWRGKPLKTIKSSFEAACERAGLEGVTPHILRHTGATWMALAAVPMDKIANMLGDSIQTTERVYAKFHPDYLKDAANALQGENGMRKPAFQLKGKSTKAA